MTRTTITSVLQHAETMRQAADRLVARDTHVPGPNDDGLRYCETCKYVWPCPPVETAGTAIVEVWHGGPDSRSWPIVERVPGGWQSGGEHYPDKVIAGVAPYWGPRAVVDSLAECLRGQAQRIESLCESYSTVLVPAAWVTLAESILSPASSQLDES